MRPVVGTVFSVAIWYWSHLLLKFYEGRTSFIMNAAYIKRFDVHLKEPQLSVTAMAKYLRTSKAFMQV